MNITSRSTRTTFAIIAVAATAITLLTSYTLTASVLALKTHSASNKDLKSLFACQSGAAGGSGMPTETSVLDCYLQSYSSSSAISNNNKPTTETTSHTNSTGSDATIAHHAGLSSPRIHHHQHSQTSPSTQSVPCDFSTLAACQLNVQP